MTKALQKSVVSDRETANADQKADPAPRFKRKRLVIMGLGLTMLLGLTSGGLWVSGLMPRLLHHHVAPSPKGPVFVRVPEIITNLSGSNGQDSYAKLKVMLEVPNVKAAKTVSMDMPRFVDMFQTYLRAMHPSELHGASGTYRLREALIARARIVAAPVQVQNVLFEELLVQ